MFKDLSFLKRRLEGEAIYAGAGKPDEISDLVFYYSSWVPKSLWMATTVMKLKRHLLPGRKAMTNLDIIFFLKKQIHHFADKVPYSQSYGGFSNSYVRMWKLNHKGGWVLKNWYFWIVVVEKTLESPLNCKEMKPVNPKGNQPWVFIGRTDAETEASILWPPDAKRRLIGKDPDAGKGWRQRRMGWQRMRWLDSITDSMAMNLSKLRETVRDRGSWCAPSPRGGRVRHELATERRQQRQKVTAPPSPRENSCHRHARWCSLGVVSLWINHSLSETVWE